MSVRARQPVRKIGVVIGRQPFVLCKERREREIMPPGPCELSGGIPDSKQFVCIDFRKNISACFVVGLDLFVVLVLFWTSPNPSGFRDVEIGCIATLAGRITCGIESTGSRFPGIALHVLDLAGIRKVGLTPESNREFYFCDFSSFSSGVLKQPPYPLMRRSRRERDMGAMKSPIPKPARF